MLSPVEHEKFYILHNCVRLIESSRHYDEIKLGMYKLFFVTDLNVQTTVLENDFYHGKQ